IWDLLAGLGAGPAGRLRPRPGAAPPGLGRSRGHGADIGAAILSRPAGRGSGVRQRTRCLFHKSTASSPGFFWERHAQAWIRGRAGARRSQGESTGEGHTKWTSSGKGRARWPITVLTLLFEKRYSAGHQRGREVDGPAGVNTMKPNREGHAMTWTLLSRRDMLKGTMAIAAAASVGVNTVTRSRRAAAQESAALPRAHI